MKFEGIRVDQLTAAIKANPSHQTKPWQKFRTESIGTLQPSWKHATE
ncbi:MAG: hypothetical protein SGJ26_07505 [Nitrospirota bacterium]|nr:hypothetical protein [Nitrospirota bacterium]